MFNIITIHLIEPHLVLRHGQQTDDMVHTNARKSGNTLCPKRTSLRHREYKIIRQITSHTHTLTNTTTYIQSRTHTTTTTTYKHTRTNIQPHSIMNLINENFQAKQFWNKFEYLTPKRCRREKKYYSSEFHLVASPIIGFCIPKIPWKLISFLKTTVIWRIVIK